MNEREQHPDCQCAEDLIGRAIFSADLSSAEQNSLDQHLAACEFCRTQFAQLHETNSLLSNSYSAAVAPQSLLPRIAAKLPLSIPTAAPKKKSGAFQVVAVGNRGSSAWRVAFISAAAAAIAVVAGMSFIRNDNSVNVTRGSIVDSEGRVASSLVAGKKYTVKKEAVVPLNDGATVRMIEGAQFAVQTGATPGMTLERGDVYTSGKNKQKPTHVALDSFEANLQQGDFFVSADDATDPRGVLIVFDGMATVDQADAPLEVSGGHVFVSVKNPADAFSELLSMAEVLERLQQDISIQGVNTNALREEYARKVAGYDKELKDLTLAVSNEGDPVKKAELKERHERVQEYRTQHQNRLKTLRSEFPSEQIRRGLDRHLPPDRWM